MVVIGNHVPQVYDAVVSVGHLEALAAAPGASADDAPAEKQNLFNAFISIVTGVFTPFLGVLSACGILKGVLALCTAMGILTAESGTYMVLYSLADSAFYFLPPILGYTAAKRFKLPELEGMVLGLAMVYPNMLDATKLDKLFGIKIIMPASGNYTSSVIPIILAVAFAAWLENRFIKKIVPDTIKLFGVPLITMFVTWVLTVWVIGPVASGAADLLTAFFNWLTSVSPIVMGAVVGFFWQILVMFGLHWALVPMAINNYAHGGDTILVAMFGTTFAQVGAVGAIWLKTKNKKLKSLSPAAFISAIAGVTEPAIYGITLPKKVPFFLTCGIAGVAGAVLCAMGVVGFQMAGMGIFGYTAYINMETNDMRGMIISVIVSLACVVAGFVLTFITYKDEEPKKAEEPAGTAGGQVEPSGAAIAAGVTGETLASPVSGTVMPLSAIKDEAFSSGALGQGVAISPSEGKLYAPCDGTIETFFPTGHAIGITTNSGASLLIHVGMDTVSLNGKGFSPKAKQGDKVKKGDLLLEFDIDAIKAAGLSTDTPIIVTNSDDFAAVQPAKAEGTVTHGEDLINTL